LYAIIINSDTLSQQSVLVSRYSVRCAYMLCNTVSCMYSLLKSLLVYLLPLAEHANTLLHILNIGGFADVQLKKGAPLLNQIVSSAIGNLPEGSSTVLNLIGSPMVRTLCSTLA
jgi:hypothetical protein